MSFNIYAILLRYTVLKCPNMLKLLPLQRHSFLKIMSFPAWLFLSSLITMSDKIVYTISYIIMKTFGRFIFFFWWWWLYSEPAACENWLMHIFIWFSLQSNQSRKHEYDLYSAEGHSISQTSNRISRILCRQCCSKINISKKI